LVVPGSVVELCVCLAITQVAKQLATADLDVRTARYERDVLAHQLLMASKASARLIVFSALCRLLN
jgi:hypothetical protein